MLGVNTPATLRPTCYTPLYTPNDMNRQYNTAYWTQRLKNSLYVPTHPLTGMTNLTYGRPTYNGQQGVVFPITNINVLAHVCSLCSLSFRNNRLFSDDKWVYSTNPETVNFIYNFKLLLRRCQIIMLFYRSRGLQIAWLSVG